MIGRDSNDDVYYRKDIRIHNNKELRLTNKKLCYFLVSNHQFKLHKTKKIDSIDDNGAMTRCFLALAAIKTTANRSAAPWSTLWSSPTGELLLILMLGRQQVRKWAHNHRDASLSSSEHTSFKAAATTKEKQDNLHCLVGERLNPKKTALFARQD